MADVLRSTTFQLEFKGQDGVTGVKQFTKAVIDAEAATQELTAKLGENTTVAVKNVNAIDEEVRTAKSLLDQHNKNSKAVAELTRYYENQIAAVGRTANEQEQLNAVYRLGANATEAQKAQVIQLVQQYQAMRAAANNTQGSFRNLRGISQNLGWQLQDIAVQAQMGTSAFVIFSQQGSQLAAVMGPQGALIGALIAIAGVIGGTLFNSLNRASDAAELMKRKLTDLTAAQKEYEKIQLGKLIGEQGSKTAELAQRIATLNNFQRIHGGLTEGQTEDLAKLKNEYDTLAGQTKKYQDRLDSLNGKPSGDYTKFIKETNDGLELETKRLKEGEKAAAIYEATQKILNKAKEEGITDQSVINRDIANITKQIEGNYALEEAKKKAQQDAKAGTKAFNAAEAEYRSLARSLTKATNTTQEEYDRRKAIIDAHVARVGSQDQSSAEAYINLEKWKSEELQKEYDKREAVRKQIISAQDSDFGKTDPLGAENEKYQENITKLTQQLTETGDLKLTEEMRINALLEREAKRHQKVLDKIAADQKEKELQTYADFTGSLGNVFTQLQDAAAEGSKEAEMLFYINRAIALAETIINTELAATKAMGQLGAFGIPSATLIRATGYASAGIIAGTTFAGAYDDGGYIPSGSSGIVAEYGNELVNGVMVKGPARVTSREDTAAMMNGGGVTVHVNNNIAGGSYTVNQLGKNEVEIIANQVFSKNIDSGVSSVLKNRNSKATKALKQNTTARSKF